MPDAALSRKRQIACGFEILTGPRLRWTGVDGALHLRPSMRAEPAVDRPRHGVEVDGRRRPSRWSLTRRTPNIEGRLQRRPVAGAQTASSSNPILVQRVAGFVAQTPDLGRVPGGRVLAALSPPNCVVTKRQHKQPLRCSRRTTVPCLLCNTGPKRRRSSAAMMVPLLRVQRPSVILLARRRGASQRRPV